MRLLQIKGFPDYAVSECGNVFKIKNGNTKKLRLGKNSNGYRVAILRRFGKPVKYMVHRLVAEAFIPKPQGKDIVNHKDGNKQNNHFANLEWCTVSENMQHAVDNGLWEASERHKESAAKIAKSKRKVTYMQALKMRELYDNDIKTIEELAKLYGISRYVAHNIVHRKSYIEP
jgi:hypothetical protein